MKLIRSMGLAALAALALLIVAGASTASAAKIVSETSITKFSSSSASEQIAFPAGSANVFSCSGPNISTIGQEGTLNSENSYSLASVATSSVSTPSCEGGRTVNWGSCQLTVHPPAGEIGGTGSIEIGPAGCGPVNLYAGGCEWTVPAQSIPATYKNTGTGTGRKIVAEANTSNLKYTTVVSYGCGSVGEHTGGTWILKFTLEGKDQTGTNAVGVRLAQLPVAFRVGGKKSENPSEQPHFVPAYGVESETLAGQVTKLLRFTPSEGGSSIECKTGTFASGLSAPTTVLNVTGTFACDKFLGSAVTVKTNSCHFTFVLNNAGPPYNGWSAVGCSTKGDAIEFQVGSICAYRFEPQIFYGTNTTYANTGIRNEEKVVAEVAATGVTYVRTFNTFFCPEAVAGGGAFSGGFTLGGVEA